MMCSLMFKRDIFMPIHCSKCFTLKLPVSKHVREIETEGLKSVFYKNVCYKNRLFLEMAKSEDSENTTHVDFEQFLAILERLA